jgi:hypothetical protein
MAVSRIGSVLCTLAHTYRNDFWFMADTAGVASYRSDDINDMGFENGRPPWHVCLRCNHTSIRIFKVHQLRASHSPADVHACARRGHNV